MKLLKLNRKTALFIKKFLVIAAIVTVLFLCFGTFIFFTGEEYEFLLRDAKFKYRPEGTTIYIAYKYFVSLIRFFIQNIERIRCSFDFILIYVFIKSCVYKTVTSCGGMDQT